MAVTNNELHSELVAIRELLEVKITNLSDKITETSDKSDKLDSMIRGNGSKGLTTRVAEIEKVITALEWATGFIITLLIGYIATKLFELL